MAFVTRRAKETSSDSSPRAGPPSGPAADDDNSGQLLFKSSSPVLSALEFAAEPQSRRGGGSGGGRARGCLKASAWALCAALALLLMMSWANSADYSQPGAFIKVEGTQFTLDCRPFYVAGFNVDNIAQAAVAAVARKAGTAGGRQRVREVFEQAAAAGLNVVRTFAHTTDPHFPLQTKPGEYDEEVFRGLDVVIAEAQRAGLRVIFSFVDNWKYYGGVDEFVDWSSTVPSRDPKFPPANKVEGDVSVDDYTLERKAYENRRKVSFFQDDSCRRMYRDHVRAVLERRNWVTGRVYREDPTIMAFNLINEPRCSAYETPECTDIFQKWVLDQATHFKSLDQRHLLTVGSEGFWGERDALRDLNPGAPASDWASKAGQDFIGNHALPMIDFASVHQWPDNWKTHNQTFLRQWVDKHVEDCDALLKKPCLVEEFGKTMGRGQNPPPEQVAQKRDPVFAGLYEAAETAIGQRRGLGGSLYWRWGFNVYRNDLPGPYGVLPEHSTFELITQHAQRVKVHMNTQPPAQECQLDCWVPAKSAFGMLRRCEHRPSVCADHRARKQYQKALPEGGSQLVAYGEEVFASQADCCRPGLGGFAGGCTTTWV